MRAERKECTDVEEKGDRQGNDYQETEAAAAAVVVDRDGDAGGCRIESVGNDVLFLSAEPGPGAPKRAE